MVATYSRIAILDGDTLTFREFPDEEPKQIKLHNEFMRCARVTLQEVSRARVLFLKKRPAAALGPMPEQRAQAGEGAEREL